MSSRNGATTKATLLWSCYVAGTLDALGCEFLKDKDYVFSHFSLVFVLVWCLTHGRNGNVWQRKESRKGRRVERREEQFWVLKNGFQYEKKQGILDKKNIIYKAEWVKLQCVSVYVCVKLWRNYSNHNKKFTVWWHGTTCWIGKIFFVLWSHIVKVGTNKFRIGARSNVAITGS